MLYFSQPLARAVQTPSFLRLRQSKLRLRQGNFEEISYFKMEAEERENVNFRAKCEISVSN